MTIYVKFHIQRNVSNLTDQLMLERTIHQTVQEYHEHKPQ